MINILLIAKKNETVSFLSGCLSPYYNIIHCDSEEKVRGMAGLSSLVLIDLSDKGIDAKTIISSINDICAHTPVIGFLNNTDKDSVADYKGLSVDNILLKSFNKEVIVSLVSKAIKKEDVKNDAVFLNGKKKGAEGNGRGAADMSANSYRQSMMRLFGLLNKDVFDVDGFINNFLSVFRDASRVSRAAVIIRDEETGFYKVTGSFGLEENVLKYVKFSDKEGILSFLSKELAVLKKEDSDYNSEREFSAIKVNFAVPLIGKKGFFGAIVFNNKVLGAAATDEELLSYYELARGFAQVIERTQSHKSLFMKKYFADNLIDSLNSGVVMVDRQGKLTDINKTACEIFRIDREIPLELKETKLPAEFKTVIKDIVSDGKGFGEREITLDDGSHQIEMNSHRITAEDGTLAGVSFIFDDPTYERGIEREARKAERYEFVNKIALRSSHELRNCLVSIRTFTQLLPEKYVDEQFRKDFYSVVSKEVERLNSLVEKLLFFAQPVMLRYSRVNINELIDESLASVKPGEGNSAAVNKNLSHQIPFIELDREQVVKAFGNIIQNAMQAMQKGGRLIITTKEAEPEGADSRYLVVQFKDTGKGAVLQNNDEVFEPFFSTKSRGLGLGLTVARKIIEEHGGSIRFEGKKDSGAEVTVRIPREPRKSKNLKVGTLSQSGKNFIS